MRQGHHLTALVACALARPPPSRDAAAAYRSGRLHALLRAAPTGGLARTPLVFVEHVMKTGGSALCAALLASRGCGYDQAANCHLGTAADLSADAAPAAADDSATPGHRRNRRASYDAQCGIAFDEPAWVHRFERPAPFPPFPEDVFRGNEVTILLVRDPWEVFASYAEMMTSRNWTTLDPATPPAAAARAADPTLRAARRNFLTQHLVAGFGPASPCDAAALAEGRRAVDRFRHVLMPATRWNASLGILAACGLVDLARVADRGRRARAAADAALTRARALPPGWRRKQEAKAARKARALADGDLTRRRRSTLALRPAPAAFRRANECDYALFKRAEARFRRDVARGGCVASSSPPR